MSKDRKRVKAFVERWKDGGEEDSQCQKFWEDLTESVLGVKQGRDWLDFERKVKKPVITNESGRGSKRIDVYLPHSKTLIEQKSSDIPLDKPINRGNGLEPLDAIHQALAYYNNLKPEERGQYMIACNFKEFIVVDHNRNDEEPARFTLRSLYTENKWKDLRDILNGGKTNEGEAGQDAAARTASDFVKELYALLRKQYKKEELTADVYHSMNVFCVRTVFCLYADDADVFNGNLFNKFIHTFPANRIGEKFKWLFYRLNKHNADDMLDQEIKAFPYVNGGLFREDVEIPRISEAVLKHLQDSSVKMTMPDGTPFHWGQISPTNFGCIFESTLDPVTRRNNGMHYTSPANIRKVIGPLFLNGFREELDNIKRMPEDRRRLPLLDFQRKLRLTTFLDPACGSGNFLTETFKELRRMEMEAIRLIPNYGFEESELRDGDTYFKCPYVVDIDQFFGIEINDFAVEVAKTALWISHCQMIDEAENTFDMLFDPLPLSSNSNIHRADALRTDWMQVTPRRKADYIIGNPPFEGSQIMKPSQKASMNVAMGNKVWNKAGKMDFVCAWYAKAVEYMQGKPNIKAAFVSTNSITQGDQVASLWRPLTEHYNVKIMFAWKNIAWESEAKDKAAVHFVIIGFCCRKSKLPTKCHIYDKDGYSQDYDCINAYLLPAEQLFISSPPKHIQGDIVPQICLGSMPNDTVEVTDKTGKHKVPQLRMSSLERKAIIDNYPELEQYLPRIFGGDDFISNEYNYCIWMDENTPHKIRNHPALLSRFIKVRDKRKLSTRAETVQLQYKPFMFGEVRQPKNEYLLVPGTSSENRMYIPMGYVPAEIICSNAAYTIENCPKWVFAVLESRLHMAWVKVVSGRLEMRYRYSASVVYNNFPWPRLTEEQKERLDETANALLTERDKEMDGQTYEDIYNPNYIPSPSYTKAIEANEKAVFEAYASFGINKDMSDEEIAIELLKQSVRISKLNQKKKKHGRCKA